MPILVALLSLFSTRGGFYSFGFFWQFHSCPRCAVAVLTPSSSCFTCPPAAPLSLTSLPSLLCLVSCVAGLVSVVQAAVCSCLQRRPCGIPQKAFYRMSPVYSSSILSSVCSLGLGSRDTGIHPIRVKHLAVPRSQHFDQL